MHSIGNTTQRNACLINDPEGAAPQGTTSYTLQKGDTLSKPSQAAPQQPESKANLLEAFIGRSLMTAASQLLCSAQSAGPSITAGLLALGGTVAAQASSFLRTDGMPFPTSLDGTPLYKQGDSAWGSRLL